jgi:hypothetical protein
MKKKIAFYTAAILAALSMIFIFGCDKAEFSGDPGNNTGTGGSMARFTIAKDHLYVVETNSLQVYNISNPASPVKLQQQHLGFGIETIFPYGDYLFIGSQNSMMIYEITNPAVPKYVSSFQHIQACDPVVANDNYAFVTLRNGTECMRSVNRLDILDISNIKFPKLVKSFDMVNPHGLGLDGSTLFLTEGKSGLKVFNITDPMNIKLLQHIKDFETFDVIPVNNLLMVIGPSGLFQYDYSNPSALEKLSVIKVK